MILSLVDQESTFRRCELLAFARLIVVTVDVTGLIAEVRFVLVVAATNRRLVTARALHRIRLIQAAESRTQVFQFVIDIEADFRQSDDHSQYGDRRNDDQFGRDN